MEREGGGRRDGEEGWERVRGREWKRGGEEGGGWVVGVEGRKRER